MLLRGARLLAGLGVAFALSALAGSATETPLLRGADAFGDWRNDAPGTRRLIHAADLPAINSGPPKVALSIVVAAPEGAMPQVPPGFTVERLVAGLENPRRIRVLLVLFLHLASRRSKRRIHSRLPSTIRGVVSGSSGVAG